MVPVLFEFFMAHKRLSSNYLSPNSLCWLLLKSFFLILQIADDRQQRFLAGPGGFSRQKIFQVQIEPIF